MWNFYWVIFSLSDMYCAVGDKTLIEVFCKVRIQFLIGLGQLMGDWKHCNFPVVQRKLLHSEVLYWYSFLQVNLLLNISRNILLYPISHLWCSLGRPYVIDIAHLISKGSVMPSVCTGSFYYVMPLGNLLRVLQNQATRLLREIKGFILTRHC